MSDVGADTLYVRMCCFYYSFAIKLGWSATSLGWNPNLRMLVDGISTPDHSDPMDNVSDTSSLRSFSSSSYTATLFDAVPVVGAEPDTSHDAELAALLSQSLALAAPLQPEKRATASRFGSGVGSSSREDREFEWEYRRAEREAKEAQVMIQAPWDDIDLVAALLTRPLSLFFLPQCFQISFGPTDSRIPSRPTPRRRVLFCASTRSRTRIAGLRNNAASS
jgi:hypothetical protein